MTDLDTRLRELAHELVLDPPRVVPFAELRETTAPDRPEADAPNAVTHTATRRGLARALAVAALVVVVVLTGIAVADRLDTEPAKPAPAERCTPDPGRFSGPDGATFGPLTRDRVRGTETLIANIDQQIAETRARLDAKQLPPDAVSGDPEAQALDQAIVRRELAAARLSELQRARAEGRDGLNGYRSFGALLVPDFIRVTCRGGGVHGWVRSSDVLPQLAGPTLDSLAVYGPVGTAMCDASGTNVGTLQTSPRYPVFADDGTTVVGHIYPPIGFRALGDEPHYYPDRNGLRPCDGDVTALPTQPASSRAQLSWPNAVNHDVDDESFRSMAGLTAPPEPMRYNDKYMAMAEQVRSGAALRARWQGAPFNPADLLVPLRDEAGRIRKYSAPNAGRALTPEEVRDPDFDLCKFQVANAKEQQRLLRQRLRENPEFFPSREASEAYLAQDPVDLVGCRKP